MRVILLLFVFLLCQNVFSQRQIQIQELNWEFYLPDSFENSPAYKTENKSIVHQYKRSAIIDHNGTSVQPKLLIITEDVKSDTEIIEYAIENIKFRIIKRFTQKDSIYSIDAAGFLGEYNRKHNDKVYKHKTYALFTVDEGKGIQIILDSTESVFDTVKPEFLAILKSLKKLY